MKRKFLAFFAALALCPLAARAQKDVQVGGGQTFYVTVAQGVPWNQLSQNYIFTPESPNIGVCLSVENNNPTSSHAISVTAYQNGDPALATYAGSTGFWIADPITNNFTTVAANTVQTLYFPAQAAAHVAIVVRSTVSATGTPDTANIFAVQSTTGTCGAVSGALPVQGPAAVGNAPAGNPVWIGVQDLRTGLMQPLSAESSLFAGNPGLLVGGVEAITNATAGADAAYQGNTSVTAPLSTFNTAWWNSSEWAPEYEGFAKGLLTTKMDSFDGTISNRTITSSATGNLLDLNYSQIGAYGSYRACEFALQVTGTVGGTSPTLNVYIQTSDDDTHWNDRVAFNQVTATGNFQEAAISADASMAPTAFKTNALTAGTVLNGPLGKYVQASWVVGGTTPSFGGVYIYANCQ